MFDVMRGIERIHALRSDLLHIGYAADEIGLRCRIDVEAQLLPCRTGEARRGVFLARSAAAYVKKYLIQSNLSLNFYPISS
jgi:hypothetical protein